MTKSAPSREYRLIESLKKQCGSAGKAYELGIGDDCAVRSVPTSQTLLSADTMVENVHFRLDLMSLREVGFKAVASSVSDIYAMGGTGCSIMIQLVFPSGDNSEKEIEELYEGIGEAVRFFETPVIGGDIAKGPCWMIAVTVLGDAGERVLYRSGAKPGDNVWVTGTPGLSGRGLDLLLRHGRNKAERVDAEAVTAHVRPVPRKGLTDYLLSSPVTACIDISDGVGKESLTVAEESGVGVIITADSSILKRLSEGNDSSVRKSEELFLAGGEDYELLFTAEESFVPAFEGISFHKVGIVSESRESWFVTPEGKTVPLIGGWDHL